MKLVELINDVNVVALANFMVGFAENHPILHERCMDYLRKAKNVNNNIVKLEDLHPEVAAKLIVKLDDLPPKVASEL